MPVPQQPQQQVDQRGRPLPPRSPVAPVPSQQVPLPQGEVPAALPATQAPPPQGGGTPLPGNTPHTVPPELPNAALHMGSKNLATKSDIRTAKTAVEGTMAKEKSTRDILREKIAARKAERKIEDAPKYARLRQVAAEESKDVAEALTEVAEALSSMAEGLTNLKDNLDLIEAPKTASIKVRLASARKFATAFRQTANETPEVLVEAVGEIYNSLDEIAAGLENLAENLGFEIPGGSPVMDAFTEEGESEIEEAKEDGETIPEQIDEEYKETEGTEEDTKEDAKVDENEESEGNPFAEKDASGSDNFIMSEGRKVEKVEIPEVSVKSAAVRAIIAARKKADKGLDNLRQESEKKKKCKDCGEGLDLDHAGCKGVVKDPKGGWKNR